MFGKFRIPIKPGNPRKEGKPVPVPVPSEVRE